MSSTRVPSVIGLGELLWDCFADSRRPGGAPANVAFHARQFGCRGIVCSRVGHDPLGDELREFLSRQGLETALVQRDPEHPTGTVTVDTTHAGHPDYIIHENAAWDYLAESPDVRTAMETADAVCFGTLAQRSSVSRQTIHAALGMTRPECLLVYDVNLRQQWYRREWIVESLRKAQIVKLNHAEVETLGPLLDIPDAGHDEFARSLRKTFGVDLVCITRAEEGCLLVGPTETADIPGEPVEVADAVGAGDAFTAALIWSQLHGWPLESSARLANAVGGLVASRPGAMPPLSDEFARLAEVYKP